MNTVYLGLGSNIDREKHISAALDALAQILTEMAVSTVFESESVGFDGDPFFNLVVRGKTEWHVESFAACLKNIEARSGRQRGGKKFGSRTLDIDILLFGELQGVFGRVVLPRDEILDNAFVLLPLSQLAPNDKHPENGLTYAQLWQGMKNTEKLWPVDFSWQGKTVSSAGRPDQVARGLLG